MVEKVATNFDDLLDGTLDDLSDIPEFKPFPNGAHRSTIKFEKKTVNEHPCVEVKLILIETLELANPNKDTPPEKGTEANVLYMMDNELGQGKFKELMKPFAELHGNLKLGQLIDASQGSEVTAVTNVRPNKEKTKDYMDIVSLQVM